MTQIAPSKRNLNMVQESRDIMPIKRAMIKTCPAAGVVLSLFTEYMSDTNSLVMSFATMQELTGYSRAALGRATKTLVDNQFIQILKSGNANVYCVNAAAHWQVDAEKKKKCVFNATIVLSEKEQKMPVDAMANVHLLPVSTPKITLSEAEVKELERFEEKLAVAN